MRQKNETATSFNQLKEITQIMQAQKRSAQTPKIEARSKKGALNPTKRAFSERQITAFRDHSQASANKSQEIKQANHANAFKTEQGLNSSLRAKQSDEALKQSLATHQTNEKGGNNAKS